MEKNFLIKGALKLTENRNWIPYNTAFCGARKFQSYRNQIFFTYLKDIIKEMNEIFVINMCNENL